MKLIFLLGLCCWTAGRAWAQEPAPSPTISPAVIAAPLSGGIPWADWFKKNALVTNKKAYVHFFFNAQDFKSSYLGENKSAVIAQTAAQLVAQLYPALATADKIKMDIVFVAERDEYGMPKWDSLERVAHLEFLKSSLLKKGKPLAAYSSADIKKDFSLFKLY